MARLSEEKIAQIQKLYSELGVYSQVAKQIGCSPATVKKYCVAAEPIPVKKLEFTGQICEISDINISLFLEKDVYLTTLTYDELNEMKGLWNEL